MTAQDNGQAPPNNADAESAVVGSIVLENDRIADVGRLRPADFYGSHHRLLFAAINDMIAAGTPVDAVTLGEEMERRGQLEEIGGAGYIVEILDSVPHSFNADYYAKIVIEKARLRRLTQLGRKILDEASDPAITRDGKLNGVWFRSGEMILVNEFTTKNKDFIQRLPFMQILSRASK